MAKIKTKKSIFLGLMALVLSFSLLSTATYAWFSMNKETESTNMELKTTGPSNMLIKSKIADNWQANATSATHVNGDFSPASTANGKDFYSFVGNFVGKEETGGIVEEGNTTIKFIPVKHIQDTNVYFAEFPLYVKATESANAYEDYKMYLSDFTVTSDGENHAEQTIRASVTTVNPLAGQHETGEVFVNDDGTLKDGSDNPLTESTATVYKFDKETTVLPIQSLNADSTAKLVSDTAYTAVSTYVEGTTPVAFTVDYTGDYYTTIIVRIWFEGQHEKCLNVIEGETVTVSLSFAVA